MSIPINALEQIAKEQVQRTQAYEEERPRRLGIHQTCEIPDYDSGKIVCLKSDSMMNLNPPLSKSSKLIFGTKRNKPPPADVDHTDLSLYNSIDELILHISIRRQQGVIVYNSRASRTLHHGWGPEEVVKLDSYSADISRSDRILVYDLGDRFQIIFGLTTIHYFVKRFSNGTPKKASYSASTQNESEGNLLLSSVIFLSVFNLSDLPMYEKEIIEGHWKSSADVGSVLSVSSQRRTCPLATLSWDNGKEIRVYHLGPGNVLQDSVYSERETTSKWYSGELHKLQVVLSPHSCIAAIQCPGTDPKSGVTRELRMTGRAASWAQSKINLKAVKNSSIAAVVWTDDGIHIRVYYQDPGLYLRAYCQDQLWGSTEWTHTRGLFKHGPHPSGTPIAAEVLRENTGNVRISLSWKDEKNQVVNISQEIPSQTIRNDPQSDHTGAVDGSG